MRQYAPLVSMRQKETTAAESTDLQCAKWVGGGWDKELDSYGTKCGFGVDLASGAAIQAAAYMQQIDERFDDGDRYYCILEDA